MKLLVATYLSNRFFYILGAFTGLFMLSYSVPWLFATMQILLVVFGLVTIYDAYLLFSAKYHLSAQRNLSSIASLHNNHLVELVVTNTYSQKLWIKIIDEIPYQLEQRDFKLESSINGKKFKRFKYHIKPIVRGKYAFGNLNIFCNTAIGLVSKREIFPIEQSVAVMPSVIEMREQELLAMRNLNFGNGENKTRYLGKSYEFDQLKNYVQGDDPRNINWKATSKTHNLMVNHFEDERSQQIYSIIDKGRNMKMPFDGLTLFDYAINATLAFSNIVLKKHDKAGMLTFSETIDRVVPADKSPRQLNKIQYALYNERYHYTEHNYELLAIQLRKLVPNRSMVFLYTNFDTIEAVERCLPSLKTINKLHRLIVVFFTNTELEEMSQKRASDVLEMYHNTIARKFIVEKEQIAKELHKHGITSILTPPKKLSANTINKYLELKSIGAF